MPKNYLQLLTILACALAFSGCMVGPNFHPPKSPQVARYNETKLPAKTANTPSIKNAGKSQTYVIGKEVSAQWWYLFKSPKLNKLIDRGIANSPTLAATYAALRQAQENFNAQVGQIVFPTFDAQLAGQRQLFPGASLGGGIPNNIFNLFNASVNVSYTLDVFGGLRRQIEALGAQVDFQQFQLIAAYVTLTSNIVSTAVATASYQEQIDSTRALIKSQKQQLTILQGQYRLGGISEATVLQQQTLLSQTMSLLPPLQNKFSQNRHALSALIGAFPNEPLPDFRLKDFYLPKKLPVSLPSNLVRQRPDVRASEALLHVASANVGVATANLFPQFNLTAAYGWQAPTPSSLFGTNTNFWNVGAQILQPVFHGGALVAKKRAAIAAYDQSLAQYRQTVLQAFQNVADVLRALETDARTLKAERSAELSAGKALKLAIDQYRLGGASYLVLLTAQQQYRQAVIDRIQAEASRYTDTIALFQALGGGWWSKTWCVKECLYEK